MDNVCHTLAGAALGEAGLKTRTRFGNAVLMISANLPDVDALAFLGSTPIVAIRRGWTHGVLAQALLPILFTGVVVLIDRLWRSRDGRRVRPWQVLLLSYAGVLSHVFLDWLNAYGIRLLMPFSNRWFYGDAMFIVDPWLWLAFGGGVFLARRRLSLRPARVALLAAAVYIGVMVWSAAVARQRVRDAWIEAHGRPPRAWMAAPVAVSPFRRSVIVDDGEGYIRGTVRWFPARVEFDDGLTPKRDGEPAVERVRQEPDFRAILTWSRFPYYEIAQTPDGTRVTLRDMRFGNRLGRATTLVR